MVGRGLVLWTSFGAALWGQQIRWPPYQDEAVRLLQEYLRVDTQNPPGNELRGAQFFHRLFDQAGIPNTIYEFEPGRANVYARLKGDGSQRPLILLNHLDTVRADSSQWRAPPLSGRILDGELYGRGALDMKGLGMLQAMTLLVAARERVALHRDLIFLATADEEVDDRGSAWMIANHPELLQNAEYLLTEGGAGVRSTGGRIVYRIGFGEKAALWIKMTASGRDGHGSVPIPDSATNRLVRAAHRVTEWQTPVRLLPEVEEYFRRIAPLETEPAAGKLGNLAAAMRDPLFLQELPEKYPMVNVLVRNTVSLTVLEAGRQTNVIPDTAACRLDVRLLPGASSRDFLAQLRTVVDDDRVKLEIIEEFGPSNSSPPHSPLFQVLEKTLQSHQPDAIVAAWLDNGYTESQMYRKLGIKAYGFSPVVATPDVLATKHGANERVPVDQIRQALIVLFEAVRSIQ
jgi:acetylornithine deacetylase/succinyl-diaminopimelate desuccinylase-like protein